MKRLKWLFAVVWIMLYCSGGASPELTSGEWTQWRGPDRDGSISRSVPQSWPDSLTQVWRIRVGEGHSSPIVANSKVFLHTRVNDREVVSCVDLREGRVLWRVDNPAPFKKNQYALSQGMGPLSTPVWQSGRLYTLGVNGLLSCFDANTGELLWRRAFKNEVDTSKLFCGTAMSPIIENGFCIVHVGDDIEGALIGYDVQTGEEKWSWTDQGPGYASPIIVEIDGVRQLITLTDEACIGVEPTSGRLLWQIEFEDEWNENIVTPVYYNRILILSGVRKGTMGVEISRRDNEWTTSKKWLNEELPMYMSSPVISGDHLFGFSNKRKGQFFCLEPRTGEAKWVGQGRSGSNASLQTSGGLLFLTTTDGEFIVASNNPDNFGPIRRYTISESPVWAQPVVMADGILVKDDLALTLWRLY